METYIRGNNGTSVFRRLITLSFLSRRFVSAGSSSAIRLCRIVISCTLRVLPYSTYESYLRILLVCFVGNGANLQAWFGVNGRTVIVLPLPVAWSLALEYALKKDFDFKYRYDTRGNNAGG